MTPVRTWSLDASAVDITGDVTLVVSRRSGKSLQGFKIEFDTKAGEVIREVCRETLHRIAERSARQYEPSLHIDPASEYLAVPDAELVQHEAFRPKRRRRSGDAEEPVGGVNPATVTIETDPQVRDLLRRASGLGRLPAERLTEYTFQFYAAVVGSNPIARIAFVRKTNPARVLRRGRMVFAYGDRLRSIEDPLLLLDERFDLVVAPDGIAVLDQAVFEQLFRDVKVLNERYPVYARAFSTLQLDQNQIETLVERCRHNSRLGNRLRQIYESGHLAAGNVTMSDVKREINKLGLPRGVLLKDGRLDFTGADPDTILKLLNDDLFIGGLSGVPYEVGSKARRR
jgi:hypothetical protein